MKTNDRQLTDLMKAAARQLYDSLPVTCPMMNLYGREMCYRMGAGSLPTDEATDIGYEIGDISYWPPAGSLIILFAWDTFFLAWVLFANMKKIRLPGTEYMDKEYHQKWFHVKACIPAIPVFAAMGVLSSLIMIWIW